MISTPIFILPERVNIVFQSYRGGTDGFEIAAVAQRMIQWEGGRLSISFDNAETAMMSLEGPGTIVRAVLSVLEERNISFTIDASDSPEPDIVRR